MARAEGLFLRAQHWLFAPQDARRLASVRIGLCGLQALRLATTDYGVVASQPAALFHPVSYMKLFDRMPSQSVATTLQICGIVAALMAAAGLALRASLGVALVCSLVLDGMLNSTGRVIVGDAVLTLCLIVVLACGTAASDAWSVRAVRRGTRARLDGEGSVRVPDAPSGLRYGWPIRTAMTTIALSLFFAGFQKLRYAGLAWVTSDNLRWILYAPTQGRLHPNGTALFIADRPWLAHVCAGASLLLETCFPLVLFKPRLRWAFILGVVVMHEAIRLAIGLDYSAQGLTVLVVFVDWPAVAERVRAATDAGAVAPAEPARSPLRS